MKRSLAAAAFVLASLTLGPIAPACPEVNRYPNGIDGQLSIIGGAVPWGARAADDFNLPVGNGNNYNVRVIKFIMLSNFALTSANVGINIYADFVPPGDPLNPQPGAVVSGTPNTPPTTRDLGAAGINATDGRPLRLYEVSYALPPGHLQLLSGRWYWVSPLAQGAVPAGGMFDEAHICVSALPTVIGQPAYKSSGVPGTGAFTTWTSSALCCIGSKDLAIYLDAVQIGRRATDFDCSLAVDVSDIFGFLGAWFGGSPTADFDGVGGVAVGDIFAFLTAWFSGN